MTERSRGARRSRSQLRSILPDPGALLRVSGEAREAQEERSWLLPYIDMVTLLLTVMVVMLAYQQWGPDIEGQPREPQPVQRAAARPAPQPVDGGWTPVENGVGSEFRELIERERLGDLVDLQVEHSRVKLQIRDSILFPLGEAELATPGLLVLDKIVPILERHEFRISIEGHTDSLPIRTPRFPSNWELSSARAATVLRYLAQRGIDPARLRAVGYADTLPRASNDSTDGRAANRRVSMVVYMGEADWTQ